MLTKKSDDNVNQNDQKSNPVEMNNFFAAIISKDKPKLSR